MSSTAPTQKQIDEAVAAARIKLPRPFTEEQMLGRTVADQEYMRGYNRCLEDVADLEQLTANQPKPGRVAQED